jgi:hypothetical protein
LTDNFGSRCIVESQRDIPYGIRNFQKFAHFYVLSAHYIALSRAI